MDESNAVGLPRPGGVVEGPSNEGWLAVAFVRCHEMAFCATAPTVSCSPAPRLKTALGLIGGKISNPICVQSTKIKEKLT